MDLHTLEAASQRNGVFSGNASVAKLDRRQAMTPYEAILRQLLEEVAQEKLESLAGAAAKGIRVRVSLEWTDQSS